MRGIIVAMDGKFYGHAGACAASANTWLGHNNYLYSKIRLNPIEQYDSQELWKMCETDADNKCKYTGGDTVKKGEEWKCGAEQNSWCGLHGDS